MNGLACIFGFAGHRARVPPDPIPNSEVKPRSVPGGSVVFGHAKPGKLAAHPPNFTSAYLKHLYPPNSQMLKSSIVPFYRVR